MRETGEGRFDVGRLVTMAALLAAGLSLGACNTPTAAVDGGSPSQPATAADQTAQGTEAAQQAETPSANIIRKPSTVSQRGTHIRAVVNGAAITNYDVQRRASFLRLRRVGGDRSQLALDELVEETIKLQEAERRNVVATDQQVDEAFANFARSNRLSTSQMSQVLGQAGVGADHFKEFIRGQISWQRVVGSKFRDETQQQASQDVFLRIRESGGQKPETTEYLLQQVIFVIPEARRSALLSQRRKEALAFRQQVTGCENTPQQATSLRDVTVRNLQRTLEPQLPEEWTAQVTATPQGEATDILNTDRGVEFLIVCQRRTVSDDNAVQVLSQAEQFESFNEKGDEISQRFLAELKAKSQIIYR